MTIHPKNMILFLAAVAIIFLGISVYLLNQGKSSVTQESYTQNLSTSNDSETLEKEINETDFTNIDREMDDIEQELNSY